MKKLYGYMAGTNLGGWISQYRELNHDHFKSFIVEEDIALIASWGMDHIRVPIDYPVLEEDVNPGVYLESGFQYLDNCIEWCKKHGLNLVIDVHRAPGFSFNTLDKNTLFTDPKMQQRFVDLWIAIARRYAGESDNIMYELLNEIVEPDSLRWNDLATRLIEGIRKVDKKHRIVVGGIDYNSVNALKDMPIFDDPNIVYNFHMYEPFALTHQRASWSKEAMEFDRTMRYPDESLQDYIDFANFTPSRGLVNQYEGLTRMDVNYIRKFLKPAIEFIDKHDLPLYCGEYGVIDHADMASREAWSEDLAEVLLEYGIGRAVWTYKSMSFAHIDGDRNPLSQRLIRAVSRH
ncbi:MAG TPA: cellulase family glycosylhydrolase [Clostridia bacterium]|nr:cellulase family glycosylhydrolase [Clostridia bacterium]